MSDVDMCELCLESLGVPPVAAHCVVNRFRRDEGTIKILRLRIIALESKLKLPPSHPTKTPPHVHPHKRKSHCDCKQRQCNSQHR